MSPLQELEDMFQKKKTGKKNNFLSVQLAFSKGASWESFCIPFD